jgi:hypothetical protein
MSRIGAVRKSEMSESVVRGVCPVCTILRHRQARLIEASGIPGAAHLCNHHAWSLARSAPATIAAEVLLRALRSRREQGLGHEPHACDFCEALKREESGELKELVEKLRAPAFLDWMRIHGMLCLYHAHHVSEQLPAESQAAIAQLLARTMRDLEQDLKAYAEQAGHGAHEGGGVLGRAAEFLVCQRGIPGEETPC